MKYKVPYRLEIDHYSKEYDDRACEISSPIYSLEQGIKEYEEAIRKNEKCLDDNTKPVRIWLWKYRYTKGELNPITIRKNY